MAKISCIALIAFMSCLAGLVTAGQADHGGLRAAMAALEQEPAHPEKFQALARAAVASDATPEQARALAVCVLGYHLFGQAANAEQAKAMLVKHHGNAYQDVVRNERLFEKRVCPDCNGTGILSFPCPKCRDGKCLNCKGAGDTAGLSSRLTCTVCRGTGRCTNCNGAGSLPRTCRACRGAGGGLEFKREAVKEAYMSLLRGSAGGGTAVGVANLPVASDGTKPIILTALQVEQLNQAYNEATTMTKPAVYNAFLNQIGAHGQGRTALFLPVENGILFTVQDVVSQRRKGAPYYYASLLDESGKRRCRLMLGTDKEYAEALQKGSTLTSSDWVSPLKGNPPWDISLKGSREVYRSAAEYISVK